MRVPVSTPGGICTVRVRRVRTRPSPEHSWHGCGIVVPKPWHCGHGRDVMTWPRKDRCTCWISPRPLHMTQVSVAAARSRAGGVAGVAAHGGVDGQLAGAAEDGVGEGDLDADEGVLAASGARARAALRAAAEERIHDVAEVEGAAAVAATACRAERIAAQVVHLALLGVAEHLVRGRDQLEPLLVLGIGVDVGMQLARQPPIGLLDLLRGRVPGHAQQGVVVGAHRSSYCSSRMRLT